MPAKIFILGLPGSGKSTVARYIEILARINGWSSARFNDYDILYGMFKADEGNRFSHTIQYDGFDVHDHTAFDDALKEVERRVLRWEQASEKKDKLIIIEFARNDYDHAFKQFSQTFLQNAYVLFLDADIAICRRRIRERVNHPATSDDHFVSKYIFDKYYNNPHSHHLPPNFTAEFGIDEQKIKVIENNEQYSDALEEQINQFIDHIFKLEGGNLLTTGS